MRDSLRLGRIFGIPVSINWSVAGVVILLTYVLSTSTLPARFPTSSLTARVAVAVGASLLFLLSLIGHELGHAIVARRNGVGVEGITLWLLGGFARLNRQAQTPGAEFRIAAAGPAANFVLAIVFAGVVAGLRPYQAADLVVAIMGWLMAVNVLLGLSNLLPGAPLDGGRILTAAIWKRTGDAELARLRSARLGMVIGGLLAVLGSVEVFLWSRNPGWGTVVVGLFILLAAKGEIAAAATRRRLASTTLSSVMSDHPRAVHESMTLDQFLNAHGPGPERAQPVVRWGVEPIGYIAPNLLAGIDPAARSWTTLGRCMVPVASVTRGWTSESVATLMERAGGDMPPMVVLHEPSQGKPVGTLSRGQVRDLMSLPVDFWGREREH